MLFWTGKEVGAFHTVLLAPQTPHRGVKCSLAMAGDEAVPGSSTALSDGVGSGGTHQLCHCSSPRAD